MKTTKIILVSDNHYHEKPLEYVLERYKDADYFFHCGDSEMPYRSLSRFARVKGNNDYDREYPDRLVLEIDGHRFLLVHGHRQLYMGYDGLVTLARMNECDVCCFGHTHCYYAGEKNGVLLLNPGSIWHNRDGTEPCYMVITIENGEIKVKRENYNFPLHD